MPDIKGIKCEKLNIGYRYDLITDICLEVRSGRIVTLIGPNGCGKTTLLKTLTGELRDRGGVVYLNGDDRSKLDSTEIAKRLSMVMTYRIRPELMTCRQVVEIGRYPYTGRLGILSETDRQKTEEAMKWTDVDGFADQLFENVSDGQKQRVLLARAICQEPQILVLDEPTSYLDIRHKIDLLQKIKDFARLKNAAVLMSVHELEIARNISDTVVALGEGRILKIGTPGRIFTEDFIRKLYHIENESTELLGEMPWTPGRSYASKTSHTESTVHNVKRGKAAVIMIQGTMSNVGKSVITAGLCRIFANDGYKVAPFKSQNMALNSYVTKEGLEMGRAQVMQAECAGCEPLVCMNPILLKPTSDTGSQVIVNGRVKGNMNAAEYYRHKSEYTGDILEAYDRLSEDHDIIVVEGAGSPVELNLKQDDIVNMGLAKLIDAPVLLVGDIDRGGIFAQLIGTLELLEDGEMARVAGMIVNKFRGDKKLFEDGIRILEEKSQKPVLGVVPYMDIRLDDEDSLSQRFDEKPAGKFDIAVIRLSHISNFTDFDTFEQIKDVSVRYVSDVSGLGDPDILIIPGSKNTIADLREIKRNGLAEAVRDKALKGVCVFGICGGFQMLGRGVEDRGMTEGGGSEEGIGLLPVDTVLEGDKRCTNITCTVENATGILKGMENTCVEGYEIHTGRTVPYEELTEFTSEQTGYCRGNVYGTYIHGFFDKKDIMTSVVERVARSKGKSVDTTGVTDYAGYKDRQYDALAGVLRGNLDMDRIYKIMGLDNDKR